MSEHSIHMCLPHFALAHSSSPHDHQSASPITPSSSQASACGKAIIIGEHAVVYGAKAVAIPLLNLNMELNLIPESIDTHKLEDDEDSLTLRALIQDAFRVLKLKPFPLTIHGRSKVPLGAGLGGSAALSVSLLQALAASTQLKLTHSEIALLANELEKRFHGTPSGLDTSVIAFRQAIAFKKGEAPKLLPLKLFTDADKIYPWRFVLIDSLVRSSTRSMIQIAAPYFQAPQGSERIAHFNDLADAVIDGFSQGSIASVSKAMNQAAEVLSEVGIVTPKLREMIEVTKSCGVLAAKPTGAGGGGCILTLLDPRDAATTLIKLKKSFGDNCVYDVVL